MMADRDGVPHVPLSGQPTMARLRVLLEVGFIGEEGPISGSLPIDLHHYDRVGREIEHHVACKHHGRLDGMDLRRLRQRVLVGRGGRDGMDGHGGPGR